MVILLVAVAGYGRLVAAHGHGVTTTAAAVAAWVPLLAWAWWFGEKLSGDAIPDREPVKTPLGVPVTASDLARPRRAAQAQALAGALTAGIGIATGVSSSGDDWLFDVPGIFGMMMGGKGLLTLGALRSAHRRPSPEVRVVVVAVLDSWRNRVLLQGPTLTWAADRRGVLADVVPGDVLALHVDERFSLPELVTVGAHRGVLFDAGRASRRELARAGAKSSS